METVKNPSCVAFKEIHPRRKHKNMIDIQIEWQNNDKH